MGHHSLGKHQSELDQAGSEWMSFDMIHVDTSSVRILRCPLDIAAMTGKEAHTAQRMLNSVIYRLN
jgi:hypothetical protein